MRNDLIFEFEEFTFDVRKGVLYDGAKTINLEPKIQQFLVILLDNSNELVTKQTIIKKLWHEEKVSDEAIRSLIKKTREALGDNARSPRFIKTIPRSGYVFLPTIKQKKNTPLSRKFFSLNFTLFILLCVTISIYAFYIIFSFENEIERETSSTTGLNVEKEYVFSGKVSDYLNVNGNVVALSSSEGKVSTIDYELQQRNSVYFENVSDIQSVASFDNKGFCMLNKSTSDSSLYIVPFPHDSQNLKNVIVPEAFQQLLACDLDSQRYAFVSADEDEESSKLLILDRNLNVLSSVSFVDLGLDHFDQLSFNFHSNILVMVKNNLLSSNITIFDFEFNTKYQKLINRVVSSILFHPSREEILLNSKDNSIFAWDYVNDSLHAYSENLFGMSQLISLCGDGCINAEINKPYRDLQVFQNVGELSAGILSSSSVERFGSISSMATYKNTLVLSEVKDAETLLYAFDLETKEKRLLKSFGQVTGIESLNFNADGTMLTGELNNRIFLYHLASNLFQYIDVAMPKTHLPFFDLHDSNTLFFGGISKSDVSQVFRFEIDQSVYERMAQNRLLDLRINENFTVQITLEGHFRVLKNNEEVFSRRLLSKNSFQITENGISLVARAKPNTIIRFSFVDESSQEFSLSSGQKIEYFAADENHQFFYIPQALEPKHIVQRITGFERVF